MTKVFTISAALAAFTFSAAAPILHDKVRRPARLFVAGDFPDKGISVTPEDLAKIVANFAVASHPIPVKTEHTDTVLDPLGEVSALYVEGNELYGVLTFSAGMDAHIRERGVEHLSVCLVRGEDQSLSIKETSLVFTPRVANAGFLTPAAVEQKLAAFSAAGKLTPAMRQSAARLLSSPQEVTFSDGSNVNVAAEFEAFLNALPVVQPRGSLVNAGIYGAGGAAVPSRLRLRDRMRRQNNSRRCSVWIRQRCIKTL